MNGVGTKPTFSAIKPNARIKLKAAHRSVQTGGHRCKELNPTVLIIAFSTTYLVRYGSTLPDFGKSI